MSSEQQDNIYAAKLEAILRIYLGAETDEDLKAARQQAAIIANLDDEEIDQLVGETGDEQQESSPKQEKPVQHSRHRAKTRYAKSSWDESKHPRENDGKFESKDLPFSSHESDDLNEPDEPDEPDEPESFSEEEEAEKDSWKTARDEFDSVESALNSVPEDLQEYDQQAAKALESGDIEKAYELTNRVFEERAKRAITVFEKNAGWDTDIDRKLKAIKKSIEDNRKKGKEGLLYCQRAIKKAEAGKKFFALEDKAQKEYERSEEDKVKIEEQGEQVLEQMASAIASMGYSPDEIYFNSFDVDYDPKVDFPKSLKGNQLEKISGYLDSYGQLVEQCKNQCKIIDKKEKEYDDIYQKSEDFRAKNESFEKEAKDAIRFFDPCPKGDEILNDLSSLAQEASVSYQESLDYSYPEKKYSKANFLDSIIKPLQYEAPRVPAGQSINGMHGGQWVLAQSLAEFYAEFFNELTEAGSPPSEKEIEAATAEIEPHRWTLDRDDDGQWEAVQIDELEEEKGPILEGKKRFSRGGYVQQYAASRSPKGGMSIQGKFYPGGQFIPGNVVASASPEEKEKIEEAQVGYETARKKKEDERRAKGPVDIGSLAQRIKDVAERHYVRKTDTRRAKRTLAAMQRYHGDLTAHRIEELVEMAERAMGRLKETNPKFEGSRNKLGKKLALFHRMLDILNGGDPSDGTPPKTPRPRKPKNENLEANGSGGSKGGLPSQELMGGDAAPPSDEVLSGATGGPPEDERSGELSDSEDGLGVPGSGQSGIDGNESGYGEGTGDGGVSADSGGGGGEDSELRDGGRDDAAGGSSRSPAERSLAEEPSQENPTDLSAGNWRYGDNDFIKVGTKVKLRQNLDAVRTLKEILAEGRTRATPEEQAILSKFCGWGQFPALFAANAYLDAEDIRSLREQLGEEEFKEQFGSGYVTGQSGKLAREAAELKSLLSEEEWAAARKSILNAHYTHPDVVKAHWDMLKKLGFSGGRFLESSAGIGFYLGMMPPEIASQTRSAAVELDTITGKMLELLYPNVDVHVKGFEKYKTADNMFDLIASNVPFGDYGVYDKRYIKHKANIHDYFFLKSVDQARPGGLIAHITSTGTLDKINPKIRAELAKQCELVSAVRFPGKAHRQNAGTDVVTDMIFLRKKDPSVPPVDPNVTPPEAQPKMENYSGVTTDEMGRLYHWKDGARIEAPDWTKVVDVPDPAGGENIPVNNYFATYPDQILGTLDRTGTMYKKNSKNVSLTEDYEQRLQDAINRMPEGVFKKKVAPNKRFEPSSLPAPNDTREGNFVVKDGKLWQRQNDKLVEQQASEDQIKRIAGHVELLAAYRGVILSQLNGESLENINAARSQLANVYDAFVKNFGIVNSKKNKLVFRSDPDHQRLLSLEESFDEKKGTATKAAIFFKDVVGHFKKADKADTIDESFGISLRENGRIDPEHMARLLGKPVEHVYAELLKKGLAFESPSGGWEPVDHYLSGNVRRKLVEARAAASLDKKFQANVDALEKIQPKDIEVDDIDVKMGTHWIPVSDMRDFCNELLGNHWRLSSSGGDKVYGLNYNSITGEWKASWGKNNDAKYVANSPAVEKWVIRNPETKNVEATFMEIFQAALNNKHLEIKKKISDGETVREVTDKDLTADVNAKIHEMRQYFSKDWLWSSAERADRLGRYYNDNFNNMVDVKWDGKHLSLPGMRQGFKPHAHIKDFVWQVISTGRGLAQHEVGLGKTTSMVCSAMELRRLGLARKPVVACLKANVEAIAKEAMDLYPGAKVLYVPSLNKENRQLMQAKIGSGDYDMIVMTHETLGKIRMSPPEEAKFLEREMEEITEALESASASTSNPDKDPTVKQLTKALEKKQVAYEKALNPEAKDDAVYFDELGIDQLFIDEAHKFKTLPVYSRQKVKGIPTGQSQRATAMLNKCQWLLKNNNNRGVVFATGTSITNTVGEAYNMQRFLIPDQLEERGIKNFDQWATLFADVENKPEFNVAGDYVPTQRMVKFTNLPELSRLSRTMMSVKWADDSYQIDDNGKIVLDKDGKPVKTIIRPKKVDNPVVIPRNRRMETYMKNLSKRAQEVKARGRSNEPGQDNMLVICTDGRKAAIDMRLVDSNAPDDPNSKVNQMVRQILDFHKKNPGQTQLVFSNIGVSNILRKDEKDRARANASTDVQADQDDVDSDEKDVTIEGVNLDSNTGFNLYGDIIGKLVAGGIPKEKIADFRNVSPAEKLRLVAGLKSGEILVALGSTQKLGTGVNCQDKVGAMHHLDVPWVPADLEQRDGRGYRHGNKNKEVNVFKYVTEGSLDQKFWDIISKKAKFIGQYLNGSNESRTADEEDTEELAPETLMALASGDPRVMEKANLDLEVPALESEQKRHMRAQEREKAITRDFTVKANKAQSKVDEVKKIVDHFDNHPDFSMEIEGVAYDKPGEAGKAIAELMKKQQDRNEFYTDSYYASREKTLKLGTYRGLPLWTNNRGNYWVDLNNSSYSSADSDTSYSVGMMPYPTGDATGEQTAKFFEQTLTGFPKMANAHAKYFSRELAENSAALKEIQTALEKSKNATNIPFPKMKELEEKKKRIKELNEELKGVRAENQKRYMDDAGSLLVADLEAENAQNKSNGSNKPAEMTEHYFANYLRKEGFDFEGFGEFNGLIDYLKSTGKIHTTEVGGIKTIRLGRDPNEPAIKAGDVADVPKVEDPKSSSQEPSEAEWSPVTHLKIAADSPKELRGVDVERLFDSAPPEKHNELADYLRDVRPDLSEAVNDIAGKPEESKQEPDEEPKKTSAAINDLEIVQKPDFKGDKRYVAYSYTPVSKKFWDENRKRKATGRASEPSKLHKDVRAAKIGDMWAVAIWGDSPEEVKARAEELQKNNLHKFSRHNRTVLKYLRLADSAKWYGDRDSARIYFDQALRFSRR